MLPALLLALAAEPTAGDIMARVAENQERAQNLRAAFVYRQNVLVRLKRGNRKLAREELREFTVAPTPTGQRKTLTRFEGRYERGGRLIPYDKPNFTYKNVDIDGELISDLAEECTDERKSRDGIAVDLFPLTREEQKKYRFKLEGQQPFRGRDAWRITFRPAPQKDYEVTWAGEVMVDAEEFEPILITTRLARGIPLAIKLLLGIDLKYIGFKIAYERFDGAWFPVSYGGEFELRALFFYRRLISLSMNNSGFQRADISSRVSYQEPR